MAWRSRIAVALMSHLRADVPHDLKNSGLNLHPGAEDDGWYKPPPVILGDGTIVQLLKDGEALKAAYDAIAGAKRLICLQVYIFGSDATGKAFAELLSRKAAEGVRVLVSYDSFGSFASDRRMFSQMRRAGVRVEEFHPVRPWDCRYSWRPFNRDHRKLVVVDEDIAWLGGLNIGDEYAGPWITGMESMEIEPWRDTAVGLRGPAAKSLFRAFVASWRYLHTGGRITRCEYIRDHDLYDVIATVPTIKSKVSQRFRAALKDAKRSALLTMAYFAPDDEMLNEMCHAAKRGVEVKLLIPAKCDLPVLTTAARSFYETLLKAGVHVYERQHVILHAKTMVIDGRISVVGSTNLDYRSIEYNCELSIAIRSSEFGEKMTSLFENDVLFSKRIRLDHWRKRTIRDRVGQWAVSRARYLL